MNRPDWVLNPAPQWTAYWETARSHRENVTRMILDSAPKGSTISIWGAGTCHDLLLPQLVDHFSQVTLADIDWQNVQWGVEYQDCVDHPRLKIAAPIDLAGTQTNIAQAQDTAHVDVVKQWIDRLNGHRIEALGRYDVVASVGMLSQIVLDGKDAIGADHPASLDVFTQTRRSHLHQMLEHINPGGHGLLVTDFLESNTVPELETSEDLEATISRELAKGMYYGLQPDQLCHDLLQSSQLAGRVSQVDRSGYWTWQMVQTIFACFAIRFRQV